MGQNRANVDATDPAGRTFLHMAIACTNRKVSEELVDCLVVSGGADINIADENGRTPLHDACSIDDSYNVVLILLNSRSANLDASDDNGCTALHCACALRSIRMVRLLIHKQANVHAVDNAGRTVLSHAGVNVDAADVNHCTALHYAIATGQNVHVLRLLLASSAVEDM
jgi:ankyrin repeat protein